jgi:hypothetical protein
VNQDVSKTGQRGQVACKFGWQDAELTHAQDRVIVVNGLASAFQGNDTVADVDATLGRDFEIAFYDVP